MCERFVVAFVFDCMHVDPPLSFLRSLVQLLNCFFSPFLFHFLKGDGKIQFGEFSVSVLENGAKYMKKTGQRADKALL